ncbi:hypothetical protein QLQ12_32565 [Actinoplanes sp. NEAU-A12]|uniref:Uncharacterized protein n=1 Tax=Actinoplanes sandaracinus TaxID=3045177 RepID=A0ABT6WUD6_9ACTN|nr:hypothetical protein [Actinoplanes sandaracinus]MDI6103353.1 hypothetical protein [Actinoplanes sandaracinus]
MPVTINRRATWAQYVTDEKSPGHAARDPQPENTNEWNPVAGVFIHYRGNK